MFATQRTSQRAERASKHSSEQSDIVRVGKKVFASLCDTPLGLTMTFCSAWAQGRPSPAWTCERRGWCISCRPAAQSSLG